jgi:hypothetical protein
MNRLLPLERNDLRDGSQLHCCIHPSRLRARVVAPRIPPGAAQECRRAPARRRKICASRQEPRMGAGLAF